MKLLIGPQTRQLCSGATKSVGVAWTWTRTWKMYVVVQRRQSKYIWGGDRGAKGVGKFFFDFGSQNGELWCILGAIYCSSAGCFTRKKQCLWTHRAKGSKTRLLETIYSGIFLHVTFVDSLTVSVSSALILCIFSTPQSFTRCITYTQAKTLRGRKDTLAQVYFYWGGVNRLPRPPPGIDATGSSGVSVITESVVTKFCCMCGLQS